MFNMENLKNLFNNEKKCESCGTTKAVKEVKLSSFSGQPMKKYLCPRCEIVYKNIRY